MLRSGTDESLAKLIILEGLAQTQYPILSLWMQLFELFIIFTSRMKTGVLGFNLIHTNTLSSDYVDEPSCEEYKTHRQGYPGYVLTESRRGQLTVHPHSS